MTRSTRSLSRKNRSQRARRLLAGVTVALLVNPPSGFTQDNAPRDADVRGTALTPNSIGSGGVSPLGKVLRGDSESPALNRSPVGPVIRRLAGTHDDVAQSPAAAPSQGGWIGRHPVLLGTAIGAGGAILWQAGTCRGSSCNVGIAGLVGAGSGAYGGLIVSAIQKAKRKQPVGRGTKFGIAAGAIAGVAGAFLACYGAGGCGGVS
jgi:hypothetical protein